MLWRSPRFCGEMAKKITPLWIFSWLLWLSSISSIVPSFCQLLSGWKDPKELWLWTRSVKVYWSIPKERGFQLLYIRLFVFLAWELRLDCTIHILSVFLQGVNSSLCLHSCILKFFARCSINVPCPSVGRSWLNELNWTKLIRFKSHARDSI